MIETVFAVLIPLFFVAVAFTVLGKMQLLTATGWISTVLGIYITLVSVLTAAFGGILVAQHMVAGV